MIMLTGLRRVIAMDGVSIIVKTMGKNLQINSQEDGVIQQYETRAEGHSKL